MPTRRDGKTQIPNSTVLKKFKGREVSRPPSRSATRAISACIKNIGTCSSIALERSLTSQVRSSIKMYSLREIAVSY